MAASTSLAPHLRGGMLLQGDQRGITPGDVRDPSRAKERETMAKLLAVTRLMGLMVTGPPIEDDPLFVTHKGQIVHLPSRIAQAESYVLEKGAKASASEASERGITAGCLSSVVLKLLAELDDVLCMGKLFDAMMAAVKIQEYRSRLYVLRLLLERLPADRLETLKHLVGVVANATGGASGPDVDGAQGGVSLDFLVRVLGPRIMRKKGAPGPSSPGGLSPTKPPAEGAASTTEEERVLELFRTFVKERAYLIFKGDAKSLLDTEAYAKSLKAAQERERESRRESGRNGSTPSPGAGKEYSPGQRRMKTTGGSGREMVTLSLHEEMEMEAKRAKRAERAKQAKRAEMDAKQATKDRELGLTYMHPAVPGGKRPTPSATFVLDVQKMKEEEMMREAKEKALRERAEREAKRKEVAPELPPVTPTKTYSSLAELREQRMIGKEVSPSKHDKGFDPTNPLRKVHRKTSGINASPPKKAHTSPNSRVRSLYSPNEKRASYAARALKNPVAAATASPSSSSPPPGSPEPTENPEWMRGRDPARSPMGRAAAARVDEMFGRTLDPKARLVMASENGEVRKSALMDGDRFTQYQRGTKTGRQPLRDNVQPIRDTRQDVVQPEALRRSPEVKPYTPRRLGLTDSDAGERVRKTLNMASSTVLGFAPSSRGSGLTRDAAQAAAREAKERELKSPGKKTRKPASISELKAKIKLSDAAAKPDANDPLKAIGDRLRNKTKATEAAAAARAIPVAQPAVASAEPGAAPPPPPVAVAAAPTEESAAADGVPVARGGPLADPRGGGGGGGGVRRVSSLPRGVRRREDARAREEGYPRGLFARRRRGSERAGLLRRGPRRGPTPGRRRRRRARGTRVRRRG